MKYKVGDKVRVRKDLEVGRRYGEYYFEDVMEEYKGKQGTIIYVYDTNYDLDLDIEGYYWTDEMLEPVAETIAESNEFTKEDLKFGDIVTLRNGDKYICINEKIINEKNYKFCIETYNKDFTYGDEITKIPELDIMKVQRIDPTFIGECLNLEDDKTKIRAIETLYERKEILTEKEREYLSGVIRPFRERIRKIEKCYDEHYVRFYIKMLIDEEEVFPMPYFEEDEEIYMGMEKNKEYTLEELGL